MAEIISGDAALDALNDDSTGGGENDKDFTKFNVGSKYLVKVLGTTDFFAFYNYGIYSKGGGGVSSFTAKNPSKKTDKGFPVEDLTPWDKAFMYHRELSTEFGDAQSTEAYKYKPELRYAMGFFDLDSGERIVIDISKKQAQTIRANIMKYEKKLPKLAFEVSKGGGGSVSLTPIIDMDEDITDKQRATFDKAPDAFEIEDFHGMLYEADDEEMIETLVRVGFDVSLIGLEAPNKAEAEDKPAEEGAEPIDIDTDALLF